MFFRCALILTCLAALVVQAASQEVRGADEKPKANALDIVSSEALGAIAIRNVKELTQRGDEFIEKTELKAPMRLSDGYRFVLMFLGLHRGLDESGSAALMMFQKPEQFDESVVLAVPVDDWEGMAANFKLNRKSLTEGKIVDRFEREGKEIFVYARYLAARGNHLFLGSNPKWVERAATGKSLRTALPADELATLARDDIMLYLNPQTAEEQRKSFLRDFETQIQRAALAPDETEALLKVAGAFQELEYLVGGLRLEDGLGSTLVLHCRGDKSREVFSSLMQRPGAGTSLRGLPVAQLIAAHSSIGDGSKNAALARALLHVALAMFEVDTRHFVSAGHRPNVVGVFGEVWQRLQGSRTALYENGDPARDGIFSLVAILETDDADRFVGQMTGLARFVNASALSPDDDNERIDEKTVAELIAQLADKQYSVRQTATTKLGLIGPAALPALERAVEADDPEVRFRARYLRSTIMKSLAEERADLLERDLLTRIQPNFAHFPMVERRSDTDVDIVEIRLKDEELRYVPELRRMLGPQWRKMRMAKVGKRVVVLLGSNTELLDRAIANTRTDDNGIQDDARFSAFRGRASSEQTVEFHLSLAGAQHAIDAAEKTADENASYGVSSFGLSIAAQQVRFDFFAPFDEAKVVVKRMKW